MPFGLISAGLGILLGGGVSARWNWWRPALPGIPTLMYHKIGDPPEGSTLNKLWVSKAKFKKQMAYLSNEGYHSITFADIYKHWDTQNSLPSNPVLITFDDGYLNNFEDAYPIMRDFGMKATLFVVVQTVGWNNQWHDPKNETRISMISWNQLQELQKAGWEIASHTMNHPRLANLSKDEVKVELQRSREIIGEFLGNTPDTFAYPYGNGEDDLEIRQLVKEAGYRLAVGVHGGKWTLQKIAETPYGLPRVFVRGDENMLDFHLQMTRGKSRL